MLFNKISIASRITIVVLLPMLAATWLSFDRYQKSVHQENSFAKLKVALDLMGVTSPLIESLQMERDIAMSLSKKYSSEKIAQYELLISQTNQKLSDFKQYIEDHKQELQSQKGLYSAVEAGLNRLEPLHEVRHLSKQKKSRFSDGKLTITTYSFSIKRLIAASEQVVILASTDKHLSLLSNAYYHLLLGKEFESMNIGVMLRLLENDEWIFSRSNRFFVNQHSTLHHYNHFLRYAPNDLASEFKNNHTKSELLNRLLQDSKGIVASSSVSHIDPESWLSSANDLRSRVQHTINRMTDRLLTQTNDHLLKTVDQKKQTIIIFLTLLSLNVVLVIHIIHSILSPLRTLVEKFKGIANSNQLDSLVPVKGNDEFAEASKAFNQLALAQRIKTNNLRTMLKHLPHGLLFVEEGGLVGEEFSLVSREILGTQNLNNRSICDLLFSKSDLSAEVLSDIKCHIVSSIGSDPSQFHSGQKLLPKIISKQFMNQQGILKLDWEPIIYDNTVTRILVIIEDISEKLSSESELTSNKEKLKMIEQLLNISTQKYQKLHNSVEKTLSLIFQELHKPEAIKNPESIYINLEEIRSTARANELEHLVAAIDNALSIKGQQGNQDQELQALKEACININSSFASYNQYYSDYREGS